jgi:hypothetical protein
MPASDLQPECDLTAAQAIEWRAAPLWLQLWLRLDPPAGRGCVPFIVPWPTSTVAPRTSHLALSRNGPLFPARTVLEKVPYSVK